MYNNLGKAKRQESEATRNKRKRQEIKGSKRVSEAKEKWSHSVVGYHLRL
jgi:hypothetical protein